MKQRLTVLLMFVSLLAVGQERLGIQRYGHVVLPVKSLATSISFYNNVLGLKAVAVPSGIASSQAWFDIGSGQQIRLVEGRPEASRSTGMNIALLVSSLRKTEQQLRQRGVTATRQNLQTGGKSSLFVSDPDGYVFEFNEGKSEGPGFLQSAAKSIWRSMTEVE
ncbi:VOC family protein [Fibrella forsythiae]|uniref:VOC family protein n=1 Tax=Fibrella forsythiae TaxID=2817061 RepID=A0ABS3JMY3_9BACT|nr:VOC family protein [Fibrella forsythiae]MBO0950252.1 VOC family protein [Fibrella forsythiae]